MGSSPTLRVLEQARVSPPANTIGDSSLPLTYYDFFWLRQAPVHYAFFYDLPITQAQFIETIIPNLKHSLSITLRHFLPFSGNLTVYPTSTQKPKICYVEGDSVAVTFAESNLDFNELTANHPRDCGMFYDLIPLLGESEPESEPEPVKASNSTKIPVFSVQVTLFPGSGIAIAMTNHHCLGDASTRYYFMKAWTSISQSGTDESFLSNGTLPIYDRLIKNPKLDEGYLKLANVESFNQEYQTRKLCRPTDKVRATFILPRTILNKLKKLVSTQVPALEHVSSFTVACAYIWSCRAKKSMDELLLFGFVIDCRPRMNPAIPAAYFGNCLGASMATGNSTELTGKQGFVTGAKLIGENLRKALANMNWDMNEFKSFKDLFPNGVPKIMIWVAGTPKLKFYEMDFGWGKPKKMETVSIDYNDAISMNACRVNDEDLEIGVCLPATEMESFVRTFEEGLEAYI